MKWIFFVTFKPLWTDILLYVLLVMVGAYFFYIAQNRYLQDPWRKVYRKPLNVFVSVILFSFLSIAILDSIHFQIKSHHPKATQYPAVYAAGQNRSVLDFMLAPLIEGVEVSYSAPFALYGFNKEEILQKDGTYLREYPRLKYSGANLKQDAERTKDIINYAKVAFVRTVLIGGALIILLMLYGTITTKITFEQFWLRMIKGEMRFPWRTLFITLLCVLYVWVLCDLLIPHYHLLGTSKVGEDVFYQTVKSIRTGVMIGTLTTLIMLPFAVLLGIMAGYFRGWVDDVIQYLYTTLSSVPGVLLIAASVLSLQIMMTRHANWFNTMAERSDIRLLALCIILGVTSWTGLCRMLRGETLKLREIDFIIAAKALGVKQFKIIIQHLLPNVSHIILISVALDFSGLVLAEAVLSYVGVGVDPTSYSWGIMINSARLEMARVPVVWWSLTASFMFMFTLVLSANIFSDSLRDAFDPRHTDR